MKFCPKCKIEKSESEFPKRSISLDGLYSYCKSCKAIDDKKYRKANVEKLRDTNSEIMWNTTENSLTNPQGDYHWNYLYLLQNTYYEPNKTEQAFKVASKLLEEKIIEKLTLQKFIELVKKISEIL